MRLFGYKYAVASVLAPLFTVAFATVARAQTVRGTIADSALNEPVSGAVVTLLDSAGRSYPAPDTAVAVSLAALPTLLEPVEVIDAPSCDTRPDRSAAFALREQTRAGLLATIVGRETNPAKLTVVSFDRLLKGDGPAVRSRTVRHERLESNQPFLAARPVDEFAHAGYIADESRGRTYFGPNADGLLDPEFAATHCFSLVNDEQRHRDQLGLAFELSHGDTVVDIAGTLWIDAKKPALRSLEFHYVNIEGAAERAGAGGFLSFGTAGNGISMIERWTIRSPRLTKNLLINSPIIVTRGGACVIDIHEAGAQIVSATWNEGTSWRTPMPSIVGHVESRSNGSPIANALVWLGGTDDSTRAGAPAMGARVDVSWMSPAEPEPIVFRRQASKEGAFAACGVETGQAVTARIHADSPAHEPSVTKTPGAETLIEEFTLTIPVVIADYRQPIFGAFDADTGAPVDSATVVDDWTGRTVGVTNGNGAARLSNLPTGKINLSVRRAGYEPHISSLNVSPAVTVPITMILTRSKRP